VAVVIPVEAVVERVDFGLLLGLAAAVLPPSLL
jgi:hypothetical protein